jgi:hypothetical protein
MNHGEYFDFRLSAFRFPRRSFACLSESADSSLSIILGAKATRQSDFVVVNFLPAHPLDFSAAIPPSKMSDNADEQLSVVVNVLSIGIFALLVVYH